MKTTTKDIKELQEKLVQTCIDFINERNLEDVEMVSFTADALQASAKYKEWIPATDSSITLEGIKVEKMQGKDGKEIDYGVRYEIGSYF